MNMKVTWVEDRIIPTAGGYVESHWGWFVIDIRDQPILRGKALEAVPVPVKVGAPTDAESVRISEVKRLMDTLGDDGQKGVTGGEILTYLACVETGRPGTPEEEAAGLAWTQDQIAAAIEQTGVLASQLHTLKIRAEQLLDPNR